MSRKTKDKAKAKATTNRATLPAEQFNTLIRLFEATELAAIRAQQAVEAAAAKRDAYYAPLAKQYNLPAVVSSIQWDDATLRIEVS